MLLLGDHESSTAEISARVSVCKAEQKIESHECHYFSTERRPTFPRAISMREKWWRTNVQATQVTPKALSVRVAEFLRAGTAARMFRRIPFDKVNWSTSSFLIGTFLMSLTLVPAYIWHFGLDWFQVALFLVMFFAVGFSITLGYHRLYSHLTFQAHWSVHLFTLIFGAAAFENSVLLWACEHRSHHKHVDHEDDPYNIREGLFQAHIGWLLFKLQTPPPFDNVLDLQRDRLVVAAQIYSLDWRDRRVCASSSDRLCVGRLDVVARRVPHCRRSSRGCRATLHLLHQLALPLHR